jgi:hypothetical protein
VSIVGRVALVVTFVALLWEFLLVTGQVMTR